MANVNIVDRTAIGNDVALEFPFFKQNVTEFVARTGWLAVQTVVGAHYARDLALGDQIAKRRKIGLAKIAFAGDGIKCVAFRLRAAVNGVVFCGRNDLVIFRIVALQTS